MAKGIANISVFWLLWPLLFRQLRRLVFSIRVESFVLISADWLANNKFKRENFWSRNVNLIILVSKAEQKMKRSEYGKRFTVKFVNNDEILWLLNFIANLKMKTMGFKLFLDIISYGHLSKTMR